MAKSTLFEISTVKMPSLQTSISPCKSLGSSFSPSDHDTEETLGFGVRVTILNLSLFFHNQLTFKKLFHFAVHCMWKQLMKPSGLSFMRRTHVSRFFKWYWAYLAHSFAQCIKINKNVLSELPKAERSVFNFFFRKKKIQIFLHFENNHDETF